jgi:[protein-PII] uridylyltransferase
MSDYDAHFVAWLVRYHLLMSWTAQRQDISDPAVIDRFAEIVGDQEHLDNLYLLTIADIRGTSPHVWNEWKGQLLAELYLATTRALRRGIGSPLKVSERIADTKRDTLELLRADDIDAAAADACWRYLDDDYFVRNPPESIAWHTRAVVGARVPDLPLVTARHLPEHGASQYLICAAESESLFSNVAGGFDRLNLNIVDARVHPLSSGLVLLIFAVLEENQGGNVGDALGSRTRRLREQILDPRPGRDPKKALLSRALKHFPIRTVVNFSAAPGDQSTMMEVIAQDRPGLLYQVSRALLQCKVLLVSAKVATFGERAEDIFYITDRDRNPVEDSGQQGCIRRQIEMSLPGG